MLSQAWELEDAKERLESGTLHLNSELQLALKEAITERCTAVAVVMEELNKSSSRADNQIYLS